MVSGESRGDEDVAAVAALEDRVAKERGERELVGVPDDDAVDDGSQPRRAAVPVTRRRRTTGDPRSARRRTSSTRMPEVSVLTSATSTGAAESPVNVGSPCRPSSAHESTQERVGTTVGAAPRDGR